MVWTYRRQPSSETPRRRTGRWRAVGCPLYFRIRREPGV